jgi:hypothetical protein
MVRRNISMVTNPALKSKLISAYKDLVELKCLVYEYRDDILPRSNPSFFGLALLWRQEAHRTLSRLRECANLNALGVDSVLALMRVQSPPPATDYNAPT